MSFYECKVGDTDPPIPFFCKDGDGNAVNLTGSTISFQWRLKGSTGAWTSGNATIVSASAGSAQYRFTAQQTATAGTYEFKVVVTSGSGFVRTFPSSDGYPLFYVRA